MKNEFRELFDVMTFYEPINNVIETDKPIQQSIISMFSFFLIFFLISVILETISNFELNVLNIINKGTQFFLILVLFLVHVPLATIVIFSISRLFSKKGTLKKLLSANYFFATAVSPFVLIFFVPFAEFAGQILLFVGLGIYFYFVNESIEKIFEFSPLKTLLFSFFYIGVFVSLAYGLFSIF